VGHTFRCSSQQKKKSRKARDVRGGGDVRPPRDESLLVLQGGESSYFTVDPATCPQRGGAFLGKEKKRKVEFFFRKEKTWSGQSGCAGGRKSRREGGNLSNCHRRTAEGRYKGHQGEKEGGWHSIWKKKATSPLLCPMGRRSLRYVFQHTQKNDNSEGGKGGMGVLTEGGIIPRAVQNVLKRERGKKLPTTRGKGSGLCSLGEGTHYIL